MNVCFFVGMFFPCPNVSVWAQVSSKVIGSDLPVPDLYRVSSPHLIVLTHVMCIDR